MTWTTVHDELRGLRTRREHRKWVAGSLHEGTGGRIKAGPSLGLEF